MKFRSQRSGEICSNRFDDYPMFVSVVKKLGSISSSERGADVFRDGSNYFIEWGGSILDDMDFGDYDHEPHKGRNFSSLEELLESLPLGVWYCPEGKEIDDWATLQKTRKAIEDRNTSLDSKMAVLRDPVARRTWGSRVWSFLRGG